MGCFDEVKVDCPHCGTINYLQSKAGDCNMSVFSLENAPLNILESLEDQEYNYCENCFKVLKISRASLQYFRVTTPENEKVYENNIHQTNEELERRIARLEKWAGIKNKK